MRNYDAIEALIEEYRSRFVKVLQQVCRCKSEYERNGELIKILGISDSVSECVKQGKPCDLGFVKVKVVKRWFSTQAVIVINNEEVDLEQFNRLVASARFFKEWYDNDCSIDSYMQPLIGADHYDIIREFLMRNLKDLQKVCNNVVPNLDLNELPTYVSNGIVRAINDLVKKT